MLRPFSWFIHEYNNYFDIITNSNYEQKEETIKFPQKHKIII